MIIFTKKDPEGSFIAWFLLLPTQQTVFQDLLNLASIHSKTHKNIWYCHYFFMFHFKYERFERKNIHTKKRTISGPLKIISSAAKYRSLYFHRLKQLEAFHPISSDIAAQEAYWLISFPKSY